MKRRKMNYRHIEKKYAKEIDKNDYYNIWLCVIFLCVFGLIMIYSASAVACSMNKDMDYDSMYYMKKQMEFMLLGFGVMFVCQYVNYRIAEKFVYLAYILSTVCILLLKVRGKTEKGATRWLMITETQGFQVAELTKVATILFLAYLIHKYCTVLKGPVLAVIVWIVGGIQAYLILEISTDLSSALVILGITFFMSFVATNAVKTHLAALAAGVILVFRYVKNVYENLPETEEALAKYPYRFERVAAWLAPEKYTGDQSYQSVQSFYAIGSGGFFGKGLGNSTQKLSHIPESQNDMILSIICEELGLIGVLILVLLFVYLLYLLTRVASHAKKEMFGYCCVIGVFAHIGIQAVINAWVNVGLFPNTGLPLPFISYGGTSVTLLLCEIALVLSIERRQNFRKKAIKLEKKRREEKYGNT